MTTSSPGCSPGTRSSARPDALNRPALPSVLPVTTSCGGAHVVRQDERAPFVTALQWARDAAYPPGEHVGQESFMRPGDARGPPRRARIGPGVAVLDLCCGVAGPGRLIAAESGCRYLG